MLPIIHKSLESSPKNEKNSTSWNELHLAQLNLCLIFAITFVRMKALHRKIKRLTKAEQDDRLAMANFLPILN